MNRIKAWGIVWAVLLMLLPCGGARGALPPSDKVVTAAIFNFEMKSGGEEWMWLEKGLADMFTTHFVRSGVAVIARDDMEDLAKKLKWVPEMAAKEKEIDEIKKQLKVSFLVTGVYTVKGEEITITAQVITSPFDLVTVPAFAGDVRFEKVDR